MPLASRMRPSSSCCVRRMRKKARGRLLRNARRRSWADDAQHCIDSRRRIVIVRKLTDCTALVTGSRSGIGFEIAAQLAEAGVGRLYINGRDEARGAQAVTAINQRAPLCDVRFHAADMRDY